MATGGRFNCLLFIKKLQELLYKIKNLLQEDSVCADRSSASLLAKQSREYDAGATFCLIFLLKPCWWKTTWEMLKASSANFPLKPSETNQRESNLRSYPPSLYLCLIAGYSESCPVLWAIVRARYERSGYNMVCGHATLTPTWSELRGSQVT